MKIMKTSGIAATLLGAVSLTSWGCAQILGADFDRPLAATTTSGASSGGGSGAGGAGGAPSTGSASTGGESTASASTASASTGSPATASASTGPDPTCGMPCATTPAGVTIPGLVLGTVLKGECRFGMIDCSNGPATCLDAIGPLGDDMVCGPTGKDDNCDGHVGFGTIPCKVKAIHTLLDTPSGCPPPSTMGAVTTDNPFKLGNSFSGASIDMMVFGVPGPGIAALYSCTSGSAHTFSIGQTCTQAGFTEDGVDPIGYIASTKASGYDALLELTTVAGHHVLIPESKMGTLCCYGTCTATTYFLPL